MGKARDLKKKKRDEGVKAKRSKNLKDGSDSEEDLEQVLKDYIREAKELNEFPLSTSVVERPSPRSGASLVPIGEKYFLFGGECRNLDDTLNYFNDLFLLRIKGGNQPEWKRAEGKNGGPGPRSAHQMAVAPFHPTQALLFGGEYGSKRDTKFLQYRDFWILNTTPSLRWERAEFSNNCPGPRSGHRMLGWRNYIVLFGGYVDSGRGELKYLNDLWLLDVRTMTWKNVKNPRGNPNWPTPRSGFCFCAVEEVLYLVGGYQSQVLNDAYTLELTGDNEEVEAKWTKLRSVPNFNRSGMSAVSLGSAALLFGGITDSVVTEDRIHGQCLNDIFEIGHHHIQAVTSLKDITGRYNAAMCKVNSNSFLIAGGIVENVDEEIALDDVIVVNCGKREFKANILQPLSFTLPEPMQLSSDDDTDSSDDSTSDSIHDSYSDSEFGYSEDDDDSELDVGGIHPNVRKGQPLKEYFEEHLEYWLSINTDLDESEKERRRLAFEACKSHFESLSLK